MAKARDQMSMEIAAHQEQHQIDIAERDKKIAELENNAILVQRKNDNTVERL